MRAYLPQARGPHNFLSGCIPPQINQGNLRFKQSVCGIILGWDGKTEPSLAQPSLPTPTPGTSLPTTAPQTQHPPI